MPAISSSAPDAKHLPTEIKLGWIFRYSYLWDWQDREGREEGDKDRPCLVLAIVTTTEDGTPVVRVLRSPIRRRPIQPTRSKFRPRQEPPAARP